MATTQPDPPQTSSDYRTDFLTILNNRGKTEKGSDKGARERGFVVLVRGGSNLKPIQSLCFDEKQKYNKCLTARYRLQPGAAIGTLIAALISDLGRIVRGQKEMAGDMLPAVSEDAWGKVASLYLNGLESTGLMSKLSIAPAGTPAQQGTLTQDELRVVCSSFHNESVLRTGQRLVLLGEISEESTELSEWQAAMKVLFTQMPERVGIVLSGAPKDFTSPTDDPHFLEITLPKEDSERTDGQAEYAYRYTDSSFHKDEPARKDDLGVNDYANAIARFVLHRQTQPPLTIGIHGPWGKGKSSFMRLVDSALIKFAEINRNEKQPELNGETRTQRWNDIVAKLVQTESRIQAGLAKRPEIDEHQKNEGAEAALWKTMVRESGVISVFFNAWQFEDAKQTWAGLASQISGEMEKTLPWISRQLLKLQYAWNERKAELILNMLMPVAVAGFVAALIILGFFRHVIPPEETPLPILLKILLPTSSALFTLWLVSSQILKVAQPISERVLSYVRLPNYRDQMGFQHRVRDDLQFVYEFVKERRRDPRVVVYIDDLDRCSENKIMEILQAINLILASCEFFVLVGMDTEMIYRAIKSYYKDNVPARFPENYLSKIVQISFYLPESNQRTRQGYLDTLFSATARLDLLSRTTPGNGQQGPTQGQAVSTDDSLRYDLGGVLKIVPVQVKEAEDTADELQTFRDYSDFLDDNPREIKRLINIHRLIKILLQKHDTSWPGERQRKLVKWLIFCDTWPDLVDDILDNKEHSQSLNCLGDLAISLEESVMSQRSTGSFPSFDRLSEFAHFKKDQDVLTGKDIDEGFRLAAYLSQLVRKSPALPKEIPETMPDGVPAASGKNSDQRPPAGADSAKKPRAGLDR